MVRGHAASRATGHARSTTARRATDHCSKSPRLLAPGSCSPHGKFGHRVSSAGHVVRCDAGARIAVLIGASASRSATLAKPAVDEVPRQVLWITRLPLADAEILMKQWESPPSPVDEVSHQSVRLKASEVTDAAVHFTLKD